MPLVPVLLWSTQNAYPSNPTGRAEQSTPFRLAAALLRPLLAAAAAVAADDDNDDDGDDGDDDLDVEIRAVHYHHSFSLPGFHTLLR